MMNISSLRGSKLTQNLSIISGNMEKEHKFYEDKEETETNLSQKKLLKTPPKGQRRKKRVYVSTSSKRSEIERMLSESVRPR